MTRKSKNMEHPSVTYLRAGEDQKMSWSLWRSGAELVERTEPASNCCCGTWGALKLLAWSSGVPSGPRMLTWWLRIESSRPLFEDELPEDEPGAGMYESIVWFAVCVVAWSGVEWRGAV